MFGLLPFLFFSFQLFFLERARRATLPIMSPGSTVTSEFYSKNSYPKKLVIVSRICSPNTVIFANEVYVLISPGVNIHTSSFLRTGAPPCTHSV